MRRTRFFRSRLSVLAILVSILLLSVIQNVYASTFIGYGSGALDGNTCSGTCEAVSNNFEGAGSFIQSPFAGTLTSVSFSTATFVPNQVLVSTMSTGASPSRSSQGCNGGGACPFASAGQSVTLKDSESLTGLTTLSYFTVNLAGPVTVANGQWVAVTFMCTTCISSNGFLGVCGASASPACHTIPDIGNIIDVEVNYLTTTPSTGSTFSTATDAILPGIITGGTFQATGTSGTTVTVNQCYGNCGNPAVTLANTNSTHTINFNQTITMLYEFQSNLNGFIQNVTTNAAKSYTNGMILNIGLYRVTSCPQGQIQFTAACPGLLTLSGGTANPAKGSFSIVTSTGQIGVSNGQWLAVAVTASFSGLDLNDTNTVVTPLFQASGSMPPSITQTGVSACTCKMGLWTWIVGNVINGGPPTTPSGCASFATIDCWLPALVNGFCSNASPQCQTSSALFWIIILTIMFEATIAFMFNRITPNVRFPVGESFLFIALMVTFIMTGLSLLVIWVPIFLFMIGAILFSKHTGRYF